MPLIPWPGDLPVGHPVIDADHEHLVGIVNRLADAMAGGGGRNVGTVLCELADYTREHFTREEQFMERTRYPGLEEHRLSHGDLIAALARLTLDYELGRPVDAALLTLLARWIADHIRRYDRRLLAHAAAL